MVEFKNGTKFIFASKPDMRLPIKLALTKFNDDNAGVKPFVNNKYILEPINQNKYLPIK
ncbi:hypothetical protein FACS1894166_13640 [Bacilli bacterium]|nr:hypothetical protein FACS1894166_13640 [Bacilli bacterium]